MRFRRLELVRYGGFADRAFDFGSGRPDLHLVVGPNEAGKSTALQAIGDLLFGIGAQTPQAWRYDYGQLRIRAVLEHDGATLDVTRRKGNRDTLLKSDGTPFGDDPLAPMLAGVDRAAFERMFGLDHLKLREGGDAILKGRDDAARITLEAGTGVTHIGRELARLQDAADARFKPSGQNPPVNRLMRERADALAQMRQLTVTDTAWGAAKQRRADAEARRAKLIGEAAELDREQARLDRIGRARAPLARLLAARRNLSALGPLPELPAGAADRLAQARAERVTVRELADQHQADLARADEKVANVAPPGTILALQARIEPLDELRPAIHKAASDLQRRLGDLERIDARITAARAEAGLMTDAALPSSGWRKRVGMHLDARRQLKVEEGAVARRRAELTRARDVLERDLAGLGDVGGADELVRTLAAVPTDADTRLATAEREAARKVARAAELLTELAPWRGDAAALAAFETPGPGAVDDVRRMIEEARADAVAARKEAEAAETSAIKLRAKLEGMVAGGRLPTPEAVAIERGARDQLLTDVRARLVAPRRGDDDATGLALAEAVMRADDLADRRDAEAARVAEHAVAAVALAEAVALGQAARAREEARRGELAHAEERWTGMLAALGFARPIAPADFAAWVAGRERALEAERDRSAATDVLTAIRAQMDRAFDEVATALRSAGVEPPADRTRLVAVAAEQASARVAAAARHERLTADLADNGAAVLDLEHAAAALSITREDLDAQLVQLARETGFAGDVGETALFDAAEALSQVADEIVARDGIARQVDGIKHDRRAFEAELGAVLADLRRAADGTPVDQVRALGAELRAAAQDEAALVAHAAERARLLNELDRADRRARAAQAVIDELLAAARAETDDDLDRIVASCARRAELTAVERNAEAELAGADHGAGLAALTQEVAGLDAEQEATTRARIETRRIELAAEREEVGGALHAAEEEATRVAGEAAAADAQQRAVDTGAELAQVAEEHVQAAAAAALLRWVVERHRATNQAPLISRAGALFAQVTGGAFTGLSVGYDAGDRPVILATRADGAEVGVDGMSEGTRDQLYLALRLGSIEGRAGAGALPVICDDLLITADDERAGALLRVLGAAAERTQVIVFSHHEHLIDVARRAVGKGGFVLHRIAPAQTQAAA